VLKMDDGGVLFQRESEFEIVHNDNFLKV